MEKQKYIDIFLSTSIGTLLREALEKTAKEMKTDNASILFMEPADYRLYELISEKDTSLRMPIMKETDKPENINIVCIAVLDWKVAFEKWKNVMAEYECPVKLIAIVSGFTQLEVQSYILKKEDPKELSEFIKVVTIQKVAIESVISWLNTQKRVLLALCNERYKNRIHTDAIELTKEQMLNLQRVEGGYLEYLGIGNLMPDLIFGKDPYYRETQHGVFYFRDQFIVKKFGVKIQLFLNYSWNNREKFICVFTPVVQIDSLAISDVVNMFYIFFPKLHKKEMTAIEKYKFIEHFFECYIAVLFKRYAKCKKVSISWNLPNCMPEESFSKLLQEDITFFVNNITKIKPITNIGKIENNYFVAEDLLPHTKIFELPSSRIQKIYLHFNLIIILKNRIGEYTFVSIEKWRRFVSDYFIQKKEVNKLLYGELLLEETMLQRGIMLETYYVKDDIVWHGFVPGENLEVMP